MSALVTASDIFAVSVGFSDDSMTVMLDDGRSIAVPIVWYPRLLHGSAQERMRFELIGNGEGIHWPDLNEDVSVEGLLAGKRSAETNTSLSRWIAERDDRNAKQDVH